MLRKQGPDSWVLFWVALWIWACWAAVAFSADSVAIGPSLQESCVTIQKSARDRGSGTIVIRPVEGEPVAWVITAEHVVADLRTVRDVIGPDGTPKKSVSYRDAEILQERQQAGRTVGQMTLDAKVVNVDSRMDIAFLRVRWVGLFTKGAEFYLGDTSPPVGTKVYHCASPGGATIGAASLTNGIVSQIGRRIEEFGGAEGIYDQTDCAGLPGSSGGMIAFADDSHGKAGQWIGMVTLGLRSGDSFHWYVPIRRVRQWAEKTGVQWLLDPKAKPPTEEQIEKIPLENTSPGFNRSTSPNAEPAKAALKIGRAVLGGE